DLAQVLPAGPKVVWINLLDSVLYQQILAKPERFIEMIPEKFGKDSWVVVDEVQRIPELLNYVHLLIEEKRIRFALTGSSARKLKRLGTNLLGGRAFLNSLFPFTASELGSDFDLDEALQWGTLPQACKHDAALEKREYLRSYVATYLREEIKEEQIIRSLDPFVRFLEAAAQSSGQIMNASKVARDSGSDPRAVLRYFDVLADTLLGFFLEPYHRSARKVQTSKSKFYLFDTGVKRALEGTLDLPLRPGTSAYGHAFEHFFILECVRHSSYLRREEKHFYIRTKDDVEIDLLIERPGRELLAVEVRSAERVDENELRAAAALAKDLGAKRFLVASREKRARKVGEMEILPWTDILTELYG
ncbi:MAG: ATP-binding protein, partial [Bdellovibrionales bacterium]|nr:ATP-binding protein [Bdellovibrionales bacterium]